MKEGSITNITKDIYLLFFYYAINEHLLHVTFTAFPLLSFFILYNFQAQLSFYFPDDFTANFLDPL